METLKNIWDGIVAIWNAIWAVIFAIWNAIWSAIVAFVEPYLIKFSNFVSPILQVPGKFMGDTANDIPLGIFGAKGIFMAYFFILIYLVMRLPKDEVSFTDEDSGKVVNLRPWSIASLSMIVVIYAIF